MKVMDRVETLEHIKDSMYKEALAIPRYNDGEYLLMNKMTGNVYDSHDILADLLKKAIKVKGQLVCINYLKPHNIAKRDIWFKTQEYLVDVSMHGLYGCGNWCIHDFQNNNEVLPYFFSGNTLLLTGHHIESEYAFRDKQINLRILPTPKKNSSEKYEEIKSGLVDYCKMGNFDNVVFACGPIGKVLLTDVIDVCDSNLIDIGALLNVIINEYSQDVPLINQGPMSWAKNIDIKKQANMFFRKLEVLI